MPTPPPSPPQLILFLITASLFVPPVCSTSRRGPTPVVPDGIRVDLIHIDAGKNYSKIQLLQRGIKRGHRRVEDLRASTSMVLAAEEGNENVQVPTHAGNGEYLMSISVGSPPLAYSAILDTGSDLIWTQCKPCQDCYKQPTPIFDPSKSSSFSKIPCTSPLCEALPTSTCSENCEYVYSYGDYSSSQGILASETFTFESSSNKVSVPKIGFGCGKSNQGSGFAQGGGLVGLGRGPLSLISQLGSGKFSYCLTSIDDTNTSPLLFGSLASINQTGVISTPLIKNSAQPSFYYLSLEGISVGGNRLNIPKSTFELQSDGSGGFIIDSGTTITYLEETGYKLVRKAFVDQLNLPVADDSSTGLDLCFSTPSGITSLAVPKLVFHFEGSDLDLPADNYMILDSGSGLLCLMIMDSSGLSILGNMQQQNMQILYDLAKETLTFAPTKCAQL
ncbi:aspartic proteinase nepenthesin-2 [Aristolochia californica]|uniref:aspartic proteinase nepenthesin-2 n=1 Tax=Aristolochia californica TaxID=171875 RepID=UPI0035D9E0DD